MPKIGFFSLWKLLEEKCLHWISLNVVEGDLLIDAFYVRRMRRLYSIC